MTVVGLVPDGFTIEDIRTFIPYRTAVQIPPNLVARSRHLTEALQQQRVMQLGTQTVAVPPLSPSLRGRGIAPHHTARSTVAPAPQAWPEREALERELEASRAQCLYLQGINETLQATLTNMTGQLTRIQLTLDAFGPRQVFAGPPAATSPGRAAAEDPAASSFLDEAIPHFIPETSSEGAEVRITIPETTTAETNVDEAVAALRSLRGKARA